MFHPVPSNEEVLSCDRQGHPLKETLAGHEHQYPLSCYSQMKIIHTSPRLIAHLSLHMTDCQVTSCLLIEVCDSLPSLILVFVIELSWLVEIQLESLTDNGPRRISRSLTNSSSCKKGGFVMTKLPWHEHNFHEKSG